jgi:hypothetical protein
MIFGAFLMVQGFFPSEKEIIQNKIEQLKE